MWRHKAQTNGTSLRDINLKRQGLARSGADTANVKRQSLATALRSRAELQALKAKIHIELAGRMVKRIHCLNFEAFSLNPFFGRIDYHARHAINAMYSAPVQRALEEAARNYDAYAVPVNVSVTVWGKGQLVDPDNALLKPIIDVCRRRVFVDDSSRYVARYSVQVLRAAVGTSPLLVIEFEEAR